MALFDAIYASAVVHHFGIEKRDALKRWEDVLYSGEPMKVAHTDIKSRRDPTNPDTARQERCGRRNGRRGVHDAIHPHDVLMMYQFQAMEPETVRAYMDASEEMAVAAERKALEEKVYSWRAITAGHNEDRFI
jgi:hypothetical protein